MPKREYLRVYDNLFLREGESPGNKIMKERDSYTLWQQEAITEPGRMMICRANLDLPEIKMLRALSE